MKKLVYPVLILVLVLCAGVLCACSVNNIINPQVQPYIEEMLAALGTQDMETAKAMLHPMRRPENVDVDEELAALVELLDGRSISECVQVSIDITSGVGTGGSYRTETGVVAIVLDDWSDLRLHYTYYTDDEGEGFTSFQFYVGLQ